MNEHVGSNLLEADLAVLFPASSSADELKPYASKPKPDINAGKLTHIPGFSNTIHLKTIGSNLLMDFSFTNSPVTNEIPPVEKPGNTVVIDSDTAKQLLLALCELFNCVPTPKGK